MVLKTTQKQLKKEFKTQIRGLKYAIYGKCFECSGFHADGYQDCENIDCSLYVYRLKQNKGRWSKSLASSLTDLKAQIEQKWLVYK